MISEKLSQQQAGIYGPKPKVKSSTLFFSGQFGDPTVFESLITGHKISRRQPKPVPRKVPRTAQGLKGKNQTRLRNNRLEQLKEYGEKFEIAQKQWYTKPLMQTIFRS